LQATQADIRQYEDTYDVGWDVIRKRRLRRMQQMGIVSDDVSLPPRQPDVVPPWNLWSKPLEPVLGPKANRNSKWPWADRSLQQVYGPGEVGRAVAWSSLARQQQQFQARKMQIHAAMIDRMDHAIGRVLAQIKQMNARENTVVLFMSDNGASAEMLVRGDGHDQDASMGSAESYLCLGPGWSTAANTPFRLHKHWVHYGGTASPLIVNWPAGLDSSVAGELRHTPSHLIDIVPTLLDLAGHAPQPRRANGPSLPGRSLVPTFAKDQRIDRPYLFYSHAGHRALRVDDWKVVSRKRRDRWELYNLTQDPNELNNLAEQHPMLRQRLTERWKRLSEKFRDQATAKAP
jgi:arylsulfatase